MDKNTMLGVMSYPNESRDDDYLFRVAVKAVILNEKQEILLVKESGRDWWDTPGGGLDHGEKIKDGLARELYEEVGYEGDFEYEVLKVVEPQIITERSIVQIRIIFLVQPDNMNFKPGDDGDEVVFMRLSELQNSEIVREKEIYGFTQLALKRMQTL